MRSPAGTLFNRHFFCRLSRPEIWNLRYFTSTGDTAAAPDCARGAPTRAFGENGEPAKQYSRDLKKFAESGQVNPKARSALDSAEGDDLKRAEQIDKRRSNFEAPER